MGLIRKAMSVSTLGGVKYTSRREAETKERLANARITRMQERQLKQQERADKTATLAERWDPIVAAIEAGEASWDDLPRLQKMSMPVSYILRCKAAGKRQHPTDVVP